MCDLSMNFSQILGKNRGCGLYSGATCSLENTVVICCARLQDTVTESIIYFLLTRQLAAHHPQIWSLNDDKCAIKYCILESNKIWHEFYIEWCNISLCPTPTLHNWSTWNLINMKSGMQEKTWLMQYCQFAPWHPAGNKQQLHMQRTHTIVTSVAVQRRHRHQ